MARRMYRDDGSWVDYAPEGEVVNRSGNWGTAGYDPNGSPVNIGGQDYYRVGSPWGTGGRFDGQTFQGKPYSDFTLDDPTYGMLARGDALKDAGRLNPSSIFDYIPGLLMTLAGPAGLSGLHAAAVGAPSLLASLGSATGLGAPLNIPHGPAFDPTQGIEYSLSGSGGVPGEGSGWEPTEGGAGPDINPPSEFNPWAEAEEALSGDYGTPVSNSGTPLWPGAAASLLGPAANALGNVGDPTIDANAPTVDAGLSGSGATGSGGSLLGNPLANPVAQSGIAAAMSRILKGEGTTEDYLSALGVFGSTALGAFGASETAGAANNAADLQRQIYVREAANRQPFVDYARNLLLNPDDYYKSAPALGAAEAATRKLSAEVGNPALNPGAISRLAAYNLGGYNDALTRALSGAGLASAGTLANIGQSAGQAGIQGAQASGDIYNVVGYGLRQLYNPYDDILRQFGVVT